MIIKVLRGSDFQGLSPPWLESSIQIPVTKGLKRSMAGFRAYSRICTMSAISSEEKRSIRDVRILLSVRMMEWDFVWACRSQHGPNIRMSFHQPNHKPRRRTKICTHRLMKITLIGTLHVVFFTVSGNGRSRARLSDSSDSVDGEGITTCYCCLS